MGTDIHLYVERRIMGEQWSFVPGSFYDGRNYDLFAMLADVRNGRGFAGVKTGDGFVTIDEHHGRKKGARGLPRGLSAELQKAADYDEDREAWLGDHSFSWQLLSDVVDGPYYDRVSKHVGIVTLDVYFQHKKGMQPASWCGGVGGGNVVMLSNAEADEILHGHAPRIPGKQYYTQVEWVNTYREACGGHWWFDALGRIKSACPGSSLDDIRLVFGFDS